MTKGIKYDLQDRLIEYAVRIIKLSQALPESKVGKHVASQIMKSGKSHAPNHGEAKSAESRSDFVHKLKIALKELRETDIWLKIIVRSELIQPVNSIDSLLLETNELISILFKSIETAKRNEKQKKSIDR